MMPPRVLKVVRIVLIILFGGFMVLTILKGIYHLLGFTLDFRGMFLCFIGMLAILFILYRNKWQFHGFYNGKSKARLPQNISLSLIVFSSLCFVIAPLV